MRSGMPAAMLLEKPVPRKIPTFTTGQSLRLAAKCICYGYEGNPGPDQADQ